MCYWTFAFATKTIPTVGASICRWDARVSELNFGPTLGNFSHFMLTDWHNNVCGCLFRGLVGAGWCASRLHSRDVRVRWRRYNRWRLAKNNKVKQAQPISRVPQSHLRWKARKASALLRSRTKHRGRVESERENCTCKLYGRGIKTAPVLLQNSNNGTGRWARASIVREAYRKVAEQQRQCPAASLSTWANVPGPFVAWA